MNQNEKLGVPATFSMEPTLFWSKTYQSLKDTFRPTLYLSLLGIAIPLLIIDTYFDFHSQGAVAAVEALNGLKNAAGLSPFSQLFGILTSYAFSFLYAMFAMTFVMGGAYFGIVWLIWRYLEFSEKVSPWQAFTKGFSYFVRRGAIALILAGLLVLLVSQLFYFLALVLAIAVLALPTTLITENRGVIWSLRYALGFGFLKIKGILQLSLIFRFLSLGMIFYALAALVSVGADYLLQADVRLPVSRALWMAGLPGAPFSYLFLGVNASVTLIFGFLLHAMAVATTVFYLVVRNLNRLIIRI